MRSQQGFRLSSDLSDIRAVRSPLGKPHGLGFGCGKPARSSRSQALLVELAPGARVGNHSFTHPSRPHFRRSVPRYGDVQRRGLMRGQSERAGRRIARIGAVGRGVSCAWPIAPPPTNSPPRWIPAMAWRSSPRVVEFGEPVPKGGGAYRIGKPYMVSGRTYVPEDDRSYAAEGVASWYGESFHGRLTANGEIFDMTAVSAAHPTLPMPSYVRVTNLANRKSMIVRVNDRGPYRGDRIIDLSVRVGKTARPARTWSGPGAGGICRSGSRSMAPMIAGWWRRCATVSRRRRRPWSWWPRQDRSFPTCGRPHCTVGFRCRKGRPYSLGTGRFARGAAGIRTRTQRRRAYPPASRRIRARDPGFRLCAGALRWRLHERPRPLLRYTGARADRLAKTEIWQERVAMATPR